MIVTVLSRKRFDKMVLSGTIEKNKTNGKKVFYLSIQDPDDKIKTRFREDSIDFKSMWFRDIIETYIDEDGDEYEVISDNQLKEIYDYILEHKDYDEFYVHCQAGISRSGAVGTFANELFGEDWIDFKLKNMNINPNPYIYNKLKQIDSNAK